MRTLGITEFAQGGCQSSLEISAYGNVCVPFFCSDVMKKERLSLNIVTGFETWVPKCEPVSKCESIEQKPTFLPRTKKFRSVPCASKVMLMLF